MDGPGNAEDDYFHEESLPANGVMHYFRCGNLICPCHYDVQECTILSSTDYAVCKECGTKIRIAK